METRQWKEREHAVWKRLPLHPQPYWLESLTSYIIRLAEANVLSMNALAMLAGLKDWQSVRSAPDYTSYSMRKLARVAGCLPTTLQDTTFYHLSRHFAHSSLFFSDRCNFFQGSVAPSVRYCPLCLATSPYYRLCWRFLVIAGCDKHECHLLHACMHCGTPIPFLPPVPHLTHCATCQQDLRTCSTLPLPQDGRPRLQRHMRDLELLLMPTQWAPEITDALSQGSGFTFLRQQKHLSLKDVAHAIERDEQVIGEIEEGNWHGMAKLSDYWHYIEVLDSSLSELIKATQIMRRSAYEQKRDRMEELALLVKMEYLSLTPTDRLEKHIAPIRPLQKRGQSTSKS